MSDEIKKFHHESAVEEEPESPERKQEQTVQKEKERTSPVVKHAGAEIVSKSENDRPEGPGIKNLFTLRILFVACIVVVAGIGIYTLFNTDNDEGPGGRRLAGSAAIAMMIKERIEAVNKFKSMYLDPENPASRFPMTLELRSFPGETYGDLFERVYGNTTGTETGMNTLGAFWRHMNFGNSGTQNIVELMEKETEDELLLFPNPTAMDIQLDLEEGSVTFQSINCFDPDLEVSVRVNNVTVR